MKNPFQYTGIVEGESFCNRETEVTELLKYCMASQNVLLYSHRRYGKTSLIHRVFSVLGEREPSIRKLYIDLYGTLTEQKFITNVFKSFSQLESKVEKLVNLAKGVFGSVKISFSFDPVTNAPSISPLFEPEDKDLALGEVMAVIKKYSKKEKLVIVFDEFQEISNYNDNSFEKRLRKITQGHQNVCYIFMGSQRHILEQMFNSSGRAFYKQAESYPLGKIETDHYVEWIRGLYHKYKDSVPPDDIINEVVNRCENHPMYIQRYFFHLWDEDELTPEIIKIIETKILLRQDNEFSNLWNSLTLNQRKTLHLLILNDGVNVFYAEALQKVELKSPSQVKKGLEVLSRKDIIAKDERYHIQDIMFKKWIQKLM